METRAASAQSLALRSDAVQSAPDVLQPQQEVPQEQARQAQKAMGVGHANALAEKGGGRLCGPFPFRQLSGRSRFQPCFMPPAAR